MSEPMSNGEIEDVLSSIRRLVSENSARPGASGDAAEQALARAEREAEAAPEALVLTEALRVEDPAPPEPATGQGEAARGGSVMAPAAAAPEDGAEAPPPEGAYPEMSAQAPAPREASLDASWEQLAGPARGPLGAAEPPESEAEAGTLAEAAPEAPEADAPLHSRIAGLEAAFDAGGDFEPDGSEMAASRPDYPWEEGTGEDTVIDLSTPDVPSGKLLFMRSPGARGLVTAREKAEEAARAEPDTTPEAESTPEADATPEANGSPEAAAEPPAGDSWPYPLPEPQAEAPREPPAEEPWPYALPDEAAGGTGAEASGVETAGEDDAPETGEDDLAEAHAAATPAEDAPEAAPQESPAETEAEQHPEEPWSEAAEDEDWPAPGEDWTAPDLPRPDEAEAVVFRSSQREAAAQRQDIEEAELVDDHPEEAGQAWSPDDRLEDFIVGTQEPTDERRLHFSAPVEQGDPWEDDEEEGAIDEAALAAALNDEESPALIDEARLVELVSEVVRQELRGALGERITQNVRKLVRREIARALETRGIR